MRKYKKKNRRRMYAFVNACLISFVDLGISFAKKK